MVITLYHIDRPEDQRSKIDVDTVAFNGHVPERIEGPAGENRQEQLQGMVHGDEANHEPYKVTEPALAPEQTTVQ